MLKVGDIIQSSADGDDFVKILVTNINDPFFRGIFLSPNHSSYGKEFGPRNFNNVKQYTEIIGNLKLAKLLYA